MRALLLAAVALIVAAPAVADGPRVVMEAYVAGPGDFACQVSNLACAFFYVEGGESSLHVSVDDITGSDISFNVCSPCEGEGGPFFCNAGAMGGLDPGDLVIVFLHNLPGECFYPGAGPPVSGTITATFS